MNQQAFFKQPEIQQLKEYFERQDDVSMAFVFGSYARGREMAESDFDVAVYLKERDKDIEKEDKIWSTGTSRSLPRAGGIAEDFLAKIS
jgi:predicted nucleotidyltransferase